MCQYMHTSSCFVDLNPDPHGSALIWLSWIQIQEQCNCLKLINEPDFQPFKKGFVPTQVPMFHDLPDLVWLPGSGSALR
jgi:hypothetical protein